MFRRHRTEPLEPFVPAVVRLHLKNDPRSVEGVLVRWDDTHYYFENGRLLLNTRREDDVPIDGCAWWQRKDVLYLQVLG